MNKKNKQNAKFCLTNHLFCDNIFLVNKNSVLKGMVVI